MYKVNPSEGDVNRPPYKVRVSEGRLDSVKREKAKIKKIEPMTTIGRFDHHNTTSFG